MLPEPRYCIGLRTGAFFLALLTILQGGTYGLFALLRVSQLGGVVAVLVLRGLLSVGCGSIGLYGIVEVARLYPLTNLSEEIPRRPRLQVLRLLQPDRVRRRDGGAGRRGRPVCERQVFARDAYRVRRAGQRRPRRGLRRFLAPLGRQCRFALTFSCPSTSLSRPTPSNSRRSPSPRTSY